MLVDQRECKELHSNQNPNKGMVKKKFPDPFPHQPNVLSLSTLMGLYITHFRNRGSHKAHCNVLAFVQPKNRKLSEDYFFNLCKETVTNIQAILCQKRSGKDWMAHIRVKNPKKKNSEEIMTGDLSRITNPCWKCVGPSPMITFALAASNHRKYSF